MNKKVVIDFITSVALLVLASCVLLLPTFEVDSIELVLGLIFGFYTIFKFTQFILIFKEKDYESLFTALISGLSIASIFLIELSTKNLALILMVWMGLMCLVKLKKADFYHDRENEMWKLRLIMLFVFLTSGLLTGMNLFYNNSVQIIVMGYFFFINSLLDIIDPVVVYLMGDK